MAPLSACSSWTGSTFLDRSQPGSQSLSHRPAFTWCGQLSVVEKSIIRNVAVGDVRLLNGKELVCADNFTFVG
jgi:hypothetical protein